MGVSFLFRDRVAYEGNVETKERRITVDEKGLQK